MRLEFLYFCTSGLKSHFFSLGLGMWNTQIGLDHGPVNRVAGGEKGSREGEEEKDGGERENGEN